MARPSMSCPACGAPVESGARSCPTCHAPLTAAEAMPPARREHRPGPPGFEGSSRSGGRSPDNPFAAELNRRLARLAQWSESAEPLGVELPRLPAWAEQAAGRSRNPEPWAEVVRGVERLAQRRIAEAFDRWEERTNARIGRLEAYSVDSRLEHSQVEDAVHAAKLGDVAQALAMFQQVDRVVALKERHLDQARGELERLLAFLRDLEALELIDAGEPAEVAAELERELRTGRLASLKQRLRLLRSRAVARIAEALSRYVAQFGDQLAADRQAGVGNDGDARELAVAARAVVLGQAEEGVRRLRALKEARGLSLPKASPPVPPAGELRSR